MGLAKGRTRDHNNAKTGAQTYEHLFPHCCFLSIDTSRDLHLGLAFSVLCSQTRKFRIEPHQVIPDPKHVLSEDRNGLPSSLN